MNTVYTAELAPHFSHLLVRRALELRAILHDETAGATALADHEVSDFKDVADHEARAALDDAQAAHAARELEQVNTAQGRIKDGTYGKCLDCGTDIDLRRLSALPAAANCTACQATHEAT
jgi:DnaK suppressor protein